MSISLAELIKTDRPHLSESSLKTYLSSLRKLGITDQREIKTLANPDAIFEKISDMKITQQRTLLSSVLKISWTAARILLFKEIYILRPVYCVFYECLFERV